jgi:hypothetical protein
MQCATIEYARDVAALKTADSTEFDPQTPHRVIYKLRELLGVDEMGGTMRLGAWPCKLEPGSVAARAYGTLEISERHRHRYEFNRDYEATLIAAGFRITGKTPDGVYVEIVEAPEHPWFLGCQFHPEFKSKPLSPHPLFAERSPCRRLRHLGRVFNGVISSAARNPSCPHFLLPTAFQAGPDYFKGRLSAGIAAAARRASLFNSRSLRRQSRHRQPPVAAGFGCGGSSKHQQLPSGVQLIGALHRAHRVSIN